MPEKDAFISHVQKSNFHIGLLQTDDVLTETSNVFDK